MKQETITVISFEEYSSFVIKVTGFHRETPHIQELL